MWIKLAEEEIIVLANLHDPYDFKSAPLERRSLSLSLGDYVAIPLPSVTGEQITPLQMTGLYINKYSDDRDIATEFLEIYSSPEIQAEAAMFYNEILLKDITRYANYEAWLSAVDYPTEEEFEQWEGFLKNGVLNYGNVELNVALIDLARQMQRGEISVEEYLSEAAERVELMVGE